MINLKECKTAYHVYETNDYGLFSFIESNRNPSRNHVENLKKQIKNGYELPPIIVRENGVSEQAIRQRLSRGYSVTRACTEGIVR